MRLRRRPPWWRHPDRPTPPCGEVEVIEWDNAELAGIHHDGLVQVIGYGDLMFVSEHLVVPGEHWAEVAGCTWLEVVDLDDELIWRMDRETALRENARVRENGHDHRMLYLPCFGVTRLDRRHCGAAHSAQ